MGQYYRPYLVNKNGKEFICNRDVNGEYTSAKLTEHSWMGNWLMDSISEMIYKSPHKIAWVGDYADFEDDGVLDDETYKRIWDVDGEGVSFKTEFNYTNKYLVNHDKKQYINLNRYIKESEVDQGEYGVWCLHPLSLMTALGNGKGGGDYYGINDGCIGEWAMNLISIEDEVPDGYEEFTICFIDRE